MGYHLLYHFEVNPHSARRSSVRKQLDEVRLGRPEILDDRAKLAAFGIAQDHWSNGASTGFPLGSATPVIVTW